MRRKENTDATRVVSSLNDIAWMLLVIAVMLGVNTCQGWDGCGGRTGCRLFKETPEQEPKGSAMGEAPARLSPAEVHDRDRRLEWNRLTADQQRDAHRMWSRGRLAYTLLPHQQEVRTWWYSGSWRRTTFNCSRRWGKSRLLLTLAYEAGLTIEGGQVMYGASTQKQVRKILMPHIRVLNAMAPPGLAPVYDTQNGAWRFPTTDALLHIAGCDKADQRENLRGSETHVGIVDEAGFIGELEYIVQSILLPQTMTVNGRMFISSTVPRTPDHAFVTRYMVEGKEEGTYIERDIYTATHVDEDKVEEYAKETGGKETSAWKREYECQVVVDRELAILPEFADHEETLCVQHPRPHYYDTYVALDFGFEDLTFALFAVWDFPNNTLVIEDELAWQHTNSETIVRDAVAKEWELWAFDEAPDRAGLTLAEKRERLNDLVYRRVADATPQLLADINSTHGYRVAPTRKDDRDAQINSLRVAIQGSSQYTLRIHPRCTRLRAHCRHGIWNNQRTEFARSGDHGHFDGIAALVYLVRNVSRSHNPYPALWQGETAANHFVMPDAQGETRGIDSTLRDIFAGNRGRT